MAKARKYQTHQIKIYKDDLDGIREIMANLAEQWQRRATLADAVRYLLSELSKSNKP